MRNIAITGEKGVGKSSVLHSYDSQRMRISFKFIHTLKLFDNSVDCSCRLLTSNHPNQKCSFHSSNDIQERIFSQIINSLPASKRPLSKYKLILDRPKLIKFLFFIFSLVGSFFILVEIFKPTIITFFTNFYDFFSFSKFYFTFYNIGFVFIIIFLAFVITYKQISLKSIKILDNEATFFDNKNDSFVNKHLDEIAYAIKKLKISNFVFEDLDRFNTSKAKEIIDELVELNFLLNEKPYFRNRFIKFSPFSVKPFFWFYKQLHRRPIRFFYTFSEDIFLAQDVTKSETSKQNNNNVETYNFSKLFDTKIQIISYIDKTNAFKRFKEELEKQKLYNVSVNQTIRLFSHYITDNRTFLFVLSDFTIFINNQIEQTGFYPKPKIIDQLLAVAILKTINYKKYQEKTQKTNYLQQLSLNNDPDVQEKQVEPENCYRPTDGFKELEDSLLDKLWDNIGLLTSYNKIDLSKNDYNFFISAVTDSKEYKKRNENYSPDDPMAPEKLNFSYGLQDPQKLLKDYLSPILAVTDYFLNFDLVTTMLEDPDFKEYVDEFFDHKTRKASYKEIGYSKWYKFYHFSFDYTILQNKFSKIYFSKFLVSQGSCFKYFIIFLKFVKSADDFKDEYSVNNKQFINFLFRYLDQISSTLNKEKVIEALSRFSFIYFTDNNTIGNIMLQKLKSHNIEFNSVELSREEIKNNKEALRVIYQNNLYQFNKENIMFILTNIKLLESQFFEISKKELTKENLFINIFRQKDSVLYNRLFKKFPENSIGEYIKDSENFIGLIENSNDCKFDTNQEFTSFIESDKFIKEKTKDSFFKRLVHSPNNLLYIYKHFKNKSLETFVIILNEFINEGKIVDSDLINLSEKNEDATIIKELFETIISITEDNELFKGFYKTKNSIYQDIDYTRFQEKKDLLIKFGVLEPSETEEIIDVLPDNIYDFQEAEFDSFYNILQQDERAKKLLLKFSGKYTTNDGSKDYPILYEKKIGSDNSFYTLNIELKTKYHRIDYYLCRFLIRKAKTIKRFSFEELGIKKVNNPDKIQPGTNMIISELKIYKDENRELSVAKFKNELFENIKIYIDWLNSNE